MSTEKQTCALIEEVITQFAIKGRLVKKEPYGNGHINDTFLLVYETENGSRRRYILQRMNHDIFKNPHQLMENVVNVTEYLRGVILTQGGDPDRETLNVVKTSDGASYYKDKKQN